MEMRPIRLIQDWLIWKVGHVFHNDGIPAQDIRDMLVKSRVAEFIKYVAEED